MPNDLGLLGRNVVEYDCKQYAYKTWRKLRDSLLVRPRTGCREAKARTLGNTHRLNDVDPHIRPPRLRSQLFVHSGIRTGG